MQRARGAYFLRPGLYSDRCSGLLGAYGSHARLLSRSVSACVFLSCRRGIARLCGAVLSAEPGTFQTRLALGV